MSKPEVNISNQGYAIAVVKRARCHPPKEIIDAVMEFECLDTSNKEIRPIVKDRLKKTNPKSSQWNEKRFGDLFRDAEGDFWGEVAAQDGQAIYSAGTRLPGLIRDALVDLEKISPSEFVKLIEGVGIKHEIVQNIMRAKGLIDENSDTPKQDADRQHTISKGIKRVQGFFGVVNPESLDG